MVGLSDKSEALTRKSDVSKCMGSEAREMRNKSVGRVMGVNNSGSRLRSRPKFGILSLTCRTGQTSPSLGSSSPRLLLSPSGVHWQCPVEASTGPLGCPRHRVLTTEVVGICPWVHSAGHFPGEVPPVSP